MGFGHVPLWAQNIDGQPDGPVAPKPVIGLLLAPEPAAKIEPWQDPSGLKASFLKKYGEEWAALSSKLDVQDCGRVPDNPFVANKWQTEDELRMNVAGPFFMFSQVGAGCDAMEYQQLKVMGKTGLACKLAAWSRLEVLMRGGPTMTSVDTLRPDRRKEESELLLELQCRYGLAGPVKLEYEGAAIPALSLADRERIKQDLHLAVPLGNLGKFSVGAKHNWEDISGNRPWTDGMQLYIGVDLKR
jgi:hypothetical protein